MPFRALNEQICLLSQTGQLRIRVAKSIHRHAHAIQDGETKGTYAYIIPNDQWDLYETGKFLSVLRMSGIEVYPASK